mmetsp:Transcript_130160/g.324535  ORF Transcript_130160/g.324535 Transcript_130160/m.324535 type:complete len:167 (+) Transcript_130160:176-676(+)
MQADFVWLIPLLIIAALIIACSLFVYYSQIYRFAPDWGPIRKFDCHGDEDLRVNQFLIHRHVERSKPDLASPVRPEEHVTVNYGSIGPPTWGVIQAPWERREKVMHPTLGEVTIRHGFTDTQYLRAHSTWWARDEPSYIQEAGIRAPPLDINDMSGELTQQRMVII